MLEFQVEQTVFFSKLIKQLRKKYPKVKADVDTFIESISSTADLGIPLGKNLYKARLKNSSAQKGKSGGFRLITYLKLENKTLTLVYIYSKSELGNLAEDELDKIAASMM